VNIRSTGRLLATGGTALKRVPSDGCLLAATLAVGAWVRLTGLDLGWYLQDQVRDGIAALGILSGRDFPLLGPQAALSTVNLVGPFYYWPSTAVRRSGTRASSRFFPRSSCWPSGDFSSGDVPGL
jgi:hypothetical protein